MKHRCPKCDTALRADAIRCPVCGTPHALSGFRPDPDRKPDPVLDPMLPLFEREERLLACSECLAEFRDDQKRCKGCEMPLVRLKEADYLGRLAQRPIQDSGAAIAAGPPPRPNDLVCVRLAKGLSELESILEELAFVGLEPYAGSDSLDPVDQPERTGIYVRAPDVEAARFLVETWRPEDPLARPDSARRAPRGPLAEAEAWISFGKYKEAARVLERAGNSGPAALLKVEGEIKAGRVRAAGRMAEEFAARPDVGPLHRGRLLGKAGLVTALAADGTPFGKGADLARAEQLLANGLKSAPRSVEIAKARIEVLERAGRREDLLRAFEAVQALCPNLFARENPFRALRDRIVFGLSDAWPFPRS